MSNLVDSAEGTTWRTCWSSPVLHPAQGETVHWLRHSRSSRISRTAQNSHLEPSFTTPSILLWWGLEIQSTTLFQVGSLSSLNPLSQLCRDWMGSPYITQDKNNFTVLSEHVAQPWYPATPQPLLQFKAEFHPYILLVTSILYTLAINLSDMLLTLEEVSGFLFWLYWMSQFCIRNVL